MIIKIHKNLMGLAVLIHMLLIPAATFAGPEKIALIIGNSAYAGEARLKNAVTDAELIAATFSELGFETTLILDLTTTDSVTHLDTYEEKAAAADIAIIYYAGHGMAVSGQNYLIPVDADVTSEQGLIETAVPLSRLLNIVSEASSFGVVLFDACRTDPRSDDIILTDGSTGIRQGLLSDVTTPVGVVLGFAAAQGQVAYDGAGSVGPYAQALHTALQENPDREISLLLENVTGLVGQATGQNQHPTFHNNIARMNASETFRLAGSVVVSSDETSSVEADAQAGMPVTYLAGGGDEQVVEPAFDNPSVPFVTECDRLAGYPRRPRVEGGSIPWSEVDPEAALRACKIDIFDYPDESFFYFILARAQTGIDDTDPAILEYVRRGWTADEGFALDLYAHVAFNGLAGVEPNRDLAFQLALLAAQRDYSQSLIRIGDLFRDNEPTDITRAHLLYRRAQEFDLPEASAKIAWLMMEYFDEEPDYAEVRSLYQVAADADFAWAINNLGVMEQRGQGIPEPSRAAAMERYEEACSMESSLACQNIAELLVVAPYGAPEHLERASLLYRQACDEGYQKSCFGLGWLNGDQRIEGADREVARALYTSACEEDHAGACNNLGNLLNKDENSLDIDVIVRVYDLWTKACELGDRNGCYSLAERLADYGDIVRPDSQPEDLFTEISDLYLRACEKDQRNACRELGRMYWNGDFGVETNYERASFFNSKACDLGNDWGCISRARLAWLGRAPIAEDPLAILGDYCEQGLSGACDYLGDYMLRDALDAQILSRQAVTDAFEIIDQACRMGERDSCIEIMNPPSKVVDDPALNSLFEPMEERILRVAEIDGDFLDVLDEYWGFSENDLRFEMSPGIIRRFQEGLRDRGLYSGAIDGIVGPGTMRALERLGN